jgi:hypothetical protein
MKDNPDTVFVFNTATDSFGNATKGDYIFYRSKLANKFGLPTKKAFSETLADGYYDKDGDVDPKFKANIDAALDGLEEISKTKKLAFNSEGYGQYLLKPDKNGKYPGIKNFLYLSEQLFERFGYINPGYHMTKTGKMVIQRTQPITDEMVRDFMKHCLNYI